MNKRVVVTVLIGLGGLGCRRSVPDSGNTRIAWRPQGGPRVETVYRTFTWKSHRGSSYTIDLAIPFAEVLSAEALLPLPEDQKLGASIMWVQRSGLATALRNLARRHGEPVPEVVLSFVQSIPYKTSEDPGLLPAHLLASGVGDCDDRVYLAVALLRVLGYDAAYWDVVGGQHAGVGIVLPGADGVGVDWHHKRYVFWETTAPGFLPGDGALASRHRVRLIFPAE